MYVYTHIYNLKLLFPIKMRKINNLIILIFLLGYGVSVNAQCDTDESTFVLDITFDNFPGETSFGLWENTIDVGDIFEGVPYDVGASSPIGFGDGFVLPGDFAGEAPGPWQFVWNLTGGETYDFGIFDTFGDGICCGFGSGSYAISQNGNMIMTPTTGEFFDIEVTQFTACGPLVIPTMGEWGTLILAISLIIFSIVVIRQTQVKPLLN